MGENASFPRRVVMARFSRGWLTGGRDSLRRGPGYREQTVELSAGAGEYTVDVRRPGSYELLLRYFRSADGGLVTITVDGHRLDTLGTYRMTEGLTAIGLTNDADGVVVADAVRLLRKR